MAEPGKWRPTRRPGFKPRANVEPESLLPTIVGVVGPQSYLFGTHAQAIYNAESLKSQLFRPSIAGATPRIGAFVSTPPQPPPDVASQFFRPAAAATTLVPQLGRLVVSTSQPYLDVASQVFPTARAPVAATTGILGKFINVPEQLADRSTPSQIWEPQFLPQGYIVQLLDQAPQFAPDVPSVIFQSARTPAIASVVAKFISNTLELPPAPQSLVFVAARATATASALGSFVYSSPDQGVNFVASVLFPTPVGQPTQSGGGFKVTPEQAYDRTLQAVFNQPWHGPQGAVPPFQITREQFFDPTPAPVSFPAQPAAPIIAGVTVFPMGPVPFQTDLNLNASVVWTPATFSPGLPPSAPGIPLGPIGPVRSMFDASHRKRRKKPDVAPETIEEIEEPPKPAPASLAPEIFTTPLSDLLDLSTKLQLSQKRLELIEQQRKDHEAAVIALWMMLDE